MYEALETEEQKEERYGWGRYSPDALQSLNSPKWATAFFCLASLVQGVTINGLLHYFLSMIERRFGLSSTESGSMSSAYDMGAMICVIPATYLGGRRGSHRPRYVGCGLLIMGTGSLFFSLPAFIGGPYELSETKDICDPYAIPQQQIINESSSSLFWVLFLGNFLHGIGASPLYTLAVTYIDDNVPVDQSSLYLGCYYMMAVIGPFLGLVGGGLFSQVNGDVMRVNTKGDVASPESNAWIGCWWCGFILSGICACIFSIPIFGLPKELPGASTHRLERERLQDIEKNRMAFTTATELPRACLDILKRPKFDFIFLAACAEALIFSGMAAFLPKLLQMQFGLSLWVTAMYMAVITIPSTLLGIYLGSTLIKIFKMGVKEILTMNVILMLLSTPCALGVFISCPKKGVIGVTHGYSTPTSSMETSDLTTLSLLADCNKDCNCDDKNYNPVCGIDDREYYSACFAGCREEQKLQRIKVYKDCSCVLKKSMDRIEAVSGSCVVKCPLFPLFVVLVFLYLVVSFAALIPSITATLRVVHTDSASLALGVQWLFVRALGTIPGPALFGWAIDLSCIRWMPSSSGHNRNCLMYNLFMLSRNLGAIIQVFKFVAIACFSIALYLAYLDEKRLGKETRE